MSDVSSRKKKQRRLQNVVVAGSVVGGLVLTGLLIGMSLGKPSGADPFAVAEPWLVQASNGLKAQGYDWLALDFDGLYLKAKGRVETDAAKATALAAIDAELKETVPPGQEVRLLDLIDVKGGLAGSGTALAELPVDPSMTDCQTAFVTTLSGRYVNFDKGSAAISADSAILLDALSGIAQRCGKYTLEVAGHTDSDGDDAANMKLSQARAEAVRDFLASRGVDASKMTPVGYGESLPKDTSGTEEAAATNRRIEFQVR